MSTITAIVEPQPDGTVHLPIPATLQHGKLKVTAVVEPTEPVDQITENRSRGGYGCWRGMIWMADDFDAPLEDFREYME